MRKYLLLKYEENCQECGVSVINPYTNKTTLEIHHIDGNRKNNLESNLQLLCPNCHSKTKTFRTLNKLI